MKTTQAFKTLRLLSLAGILISYLLFSQSCYYDVEEVIYPSINCDTADVSYTLDVLPIIQNNCLSCHSQASNFGNVTLEGYTNMKTYADNGKLFGTINHQPGFSAMPQNQAQLRTCEIAKIEKWILDGSPDN